MACSSDSNSASDGNSRIEPHFPDPNEISMNNNYVGESSSSSLFLSKGKNVDRKGKYKKRDKMKLKCPLPPRHPKPISAPAASRASLSLDLAIEHELIHGRQLDPNLDNKAVRRTISNRLSAQRSRLKRMQYVVDLEKRVQELKDQVSSLNPKLEDFTEKRKILEIENASLRTQVEIRAAESRLSEARLEERRRELMELKKLHEPSSSNVDSEAHMQFSQLDMNIVPEFEMQVVAEVEIEVPEVEMMQVSASDEARPKPYSIEFYQERLMQMEMNQFINQELNNLAPSLPPPQPEDDDLWIELAIDDDDDDDLEIDQYLNLDEIDLLHPNDV